MQLNTKKKYKKASAGTDLSYSADKSIVRIALSVLCYK